MNLEALVDALDKGDRRALAKVITLTESERESDRLLARQVHSRLPTRPTAALRLGITGPPGAGKSTLIDALGQVIVRDNERLAVLAYDPSSRMGGSILADKTRMDSLIKSERAFVRPSPTRGSPGGIGARALSTVRLCEKAGFDPIVLETVGVGQAEVDVADLVDVLVVILVPQLGDELQSIKRGLLEYADLVVVNKADGDLADSAEHAASVCQQALGWFGWGTSDGAPHVMTASAREGRGVEQLWGEVSARWRRRLTDGSLLERRAARRGRLFERAVERALAARALGSRQAEALRDRVVGGELEVEEGVERLLAVWPA